MTPKEKANDLFNKIYKLDHRAWYNIAKQCALIAVDEIISANPHSNPLNTDVYSTMNYWQEVKQEIEKL